MHILFDHQAFSRQSVGGVSRSFVELAKALNEISDSKAQILAPIHWNDYLCRPDCSSFAYGFRQRRAVHCLRNARWWTNYAFTTGTCWIVPPNIIHETWYSTKPYKLPRKVRTATTVHDLIYQIHPEWIHDADERTRYLTSSVDRADIIFCVSEYTRNDLLNWRPSLDPNRVFIVRHGATNLGEGATSEKFREADEKVFKLQNLAPGFFLYVGQRSSINKNFPFLVRALASSGVLKEFLLVCFGGGSFNLAEISLFDTLSVSTRIFQMSGEDCLLRALYQNAIAFVYPSLYEGFGMPLIEAMSLECPVISSRSTCLPEIGGDACLYFDPSDIEEAASILNLFTKHSSLREDLVSRARARAQQFTWQTAARDAMVAYQSLF